MQVRHCGRYCYRLQWRTDMQAGTSASWRLLAAARKTDLSSWLALVVLCSVSQHHVMFSESAHVMLNTERQLFK